MEEHTHDEPLDLLVVGGGPGGTAAAFRAKELGLSTLVIDYDDLMKRIRDYSKDKLILPSFGGGASMCFPKGGDLISGLHFAPIDKDEMCRTWKSLYRQHRIPARTGIELTGLKRHRDGYYEAQAWDHQNRCEAVFRAHHVALAIGRGVPRRFDIPGDTDGIAFRLEDPSDYVGRPACVIGGGTSAAEAVIAISRAKAALGDSCAVYWSYRGSRMPRVSKALAEVFFEAYVGHGNIRYFPESEPAAIITAEDREEYLAIRTDRRWIEGRPNETTQLEFPKDSCIACIGEDIPEQLLAGFGIPMVCGGAKGRKRMVVNRYLETQVPNVYLVGDILSQAHFETEDFEADPSAFREVKHRGNIKAAMRDGVLVAGVVRQRMDGAAEIEISIEDAEEPADGSGLDGPALLRATPTSTDGPPEQSLAADRRGTVSTAFLLRILPGEIEGDEFPLAQQGVTTIGRSGCDINCPDDTLLSPRHASISHTSEGFFLRDDGSASGVFLNLAPGQRRKVETGDLIRCGRQFLMISQAEGRPALIHYDERGQEVARHALPASTIILGRQAPDIILDPQDRTLSRRQLAISRHGDEVLVKDLKSANGTFLRVSNGTLLNHGDRFRVGRQRFLLSLREDASLSPDRPSPGVVAITTPPEAIAVPAPGATSPPPQPGPGTGPVATLKGLGKRITLQPGQTLCEAAEAAGIPITAECHSGVCGSDPIRILSGHENLDAEPGDQERDTLEDLCDLEPGPCRLACMVRVKGPVEVEIL